ARRPINATGSSAARGFMEVFPCHRILAQSISRWRRVFLIPSADHRRSFLVRATRREAFGAVLGLAMGSRALAKAPAQKPLAEKPLPVRRPGGPPGGGPLPLNEFGAA